jgi:pectate lyase
MSVHVYNNYYDGNSKYGVGAAYKSNAFVENNYFRGNKCPMLISQQGSDISSDPDGTFSGEDGGMIKSFGNVMVENTKYFKYVTYQQNNTQFDAYEASSRDEKVPANVVALKGGRGYDNFDTDASIMYEYDVDDANAVPDIVTGWLGAGRMNHGDFKWTIFKSLDTDYKVDNALKSALVSYTNTDLIGVIGDENAGSGESGGDNPGGEGGGGEQGGGDNPGTEITADVECSFVNGIPSNSLFTATGSKGDSKGDYVVTYNGNTYNSGLKLNSSGTVTFTTTEIMNMILILSKAKANAVKIDGTNLSGVEVENYYLVTYNNLAAGEHTIAKGASEGLLIYIGLTKVE